MFIVFSFFADQGESWKVNNGKSSQHITSDERQKNKEKIVCIYCIFREQLRSKRRVWKKYCLEPIQLVESGPKLMKTMLYL